MSDCCGTAWRQAPPPAPLYNLVVRRRKKKGLDREGKAEKEKTVVQCKDVWCGLFEVWE